MKAPADRASSDGSDEASLSGPPTPFRRVFLYGLTRGLFEGLMGIRALVLAPLLGPAGVGAWALFRIGLRYSQFAGLGVGRGLERETVREGVLGVQGEDASRAALGFTLLVFTTLGAVLLGASLFVSDRSLALGLRGLAAAMLAHQLVAYALVYLRARGSLRAYARLELTLAVLHVGFTLGFAWLWGIAGAFAGYVCADLIGLAVVLPTVPFRPTLSLKVVRRLLRVGFPLMLTGVTAIALATADRLVVAAMAGTEALGYYAFAASIAGLAASGAWVIRIVILPDVYSHAVRAGAAPAVRHHLEGTLLSYARLFPPLLGLAALAIGPAVVLVLPQFAPAVPPARIFIFTGVTFGLVNLGALALVAADRQRRLPFYAVGALAINLFVSWALLRAGAGLEGVAAGAVLSQALYAAVVLDLGANAGGISGARFLIRALTPLAWCGVVVFVIGRLVPGSELTSFAVATGLYLLGLLPLYPSLWSESRKLHRMSRTRRALDAPEEESSA